jgi:hypothetical protein
MVKVEGNSPRDLPGRPAAVALVPNQRRSLIQAMRQVAIKIVHQRLVRESFNYQSFFSSPGFG